MKLVLAALMLASSSAFATTVDTTNSTTVDKLKCMGTDRSHQIVVTRIDQQRFKAEDYVTIDAPGAPGGYQYYEVGGVLEADLVDLFYVENGMKKPFLRGLGRNLFAFGSLPVDCR